MHTRGPEEAFTTEPYGYFVPRLKGIPRPGVDDLEAGLTPQSLTGTVQLDHRQLSGKAANMVGYVPTVAAHLLHLDPDTNEPLGPERNGRRRKGHDGYVLSSLLGLVFLPFRRRTITLRLDQVSWPVAPPSLARSMMVWEDHAPPARLADAVKATEPESLVVPFVDAVAATQVRESPRRLGGGAKSAGAVRIHLEDADGRRRCILLRTADANYGDPGVMGLWRFRADLWSMQQELKRRVTSEVWTRHGTSPATELSEEVRAEILSEVEDVWVLWREENGMGDDFFGGISQKELEMFFADMAPVMPYYQRFPGLVETFIHIPGALPPERLAEGGPAPADAPPKTNAPQPPPDAPSPPASPAPDSVPRTPPPS